MQLIDSSSADSSSSCDLSLPRLPEPPQQLDLLAGDLIQRRQPARQLRRNRGNRSASPLPPLIRSTASTVRWYSSSISAEHRLPHSRVRHQLRVLPRDLEVHVGQRLLDLVHDQAEEPRVAEHPLDERGAALRPAPAGR